MKRKLSVLLTVLVVAGLILSVGCGNQAAVSKADEYVPIEERGYANPDALISPDELKEIKDRDDVVVVDFRNKLKYHTGHIPGAINVWRPDQENPDHEYGGMKATPEQMAQMLGEKGISNDDLVVVYTEGGGHDAARMWWILTMYGHEDVKLLDGGIDYWKELGYDTKLMGSSRDATEYEIQEENVDESMLATVEDVQEAIGDQDKVILDTRSKGEYTGEKLKGDVPRGGRIPTSPWIEWTEPINDDNTLKTAEEIREIYESKGVTPDKTIIPYCQSAVRSSHTTFVLTQLLGYEEEKVQNYDGSWIEWSRREDLDIEKGE